MCPLETGEVQEDAVIELTPAPIVPAVHDAQTVDTARDGSPAEMNGRSSQPNTNHVMDNRLFNNVGFGSSNTGFQAGVIHGPVSLALHPPINIAYHSIFDSLALREDRFVGQQPTRIKESKIRYRTARLSPTEPVDKFTPYVPIRDRNIKAQLCRIAELFQFIDNGFAQYFQAVVSRLPHDAVEGYLDSARDEVENKQALDRNQALGQHKDQSDAVRNLGDLGNFCQKVSDKLKLDDERGVLFDITDCTQEDMLHYLQDAFEIPYWRFMLDLFLQQNVNSRSLSATVVFRVLSSLKIEILHRRDAIRRDLAASQNGRREDTEPLMKGIDARVKVLEQVWHKDTFELEASGPYQTLFQTLNPDQPSTAPEEESTTSAKTFSAWPENQQSNAKDTIIFIGLIALFFIASLIPGYKAFSISINTPGAGSTSDADFWNLLQSSVIAVLGSLMSVVPLMRGSYFSAAYTVTWALWGCGCACAIIAASVYPFCNTAYSSAVSYFGSVFSLMAVLVATQVVPKVVVSVGDKTK